MTLPATSRLCLDKPNNQSIIWRKGNVSHSFGLSRAERPVYSDRGHARVPAHEIFPILGDYGCDAGIMLGFVQTLNAYKVDVHKDTSNQFSLAKREGFEPPEPFSSLVFGTRSINKTQTPLHMWQPQMELNHRLPVQSRSH